MKPFAFLLLAACLAYAPCFAEDNPDYPPWWYEMGLVNSAAPAGNHSPVNQGQLKNIAVRAQAYVKFMLHDSSFEAYWAAVYADPDRNPYTNDSQPVPVLTNTGNNQVLVNQGQGKHVAWGFYELLNRFGNKTEADIKQMLRLHGPSDWPSRFPWDPSVGATANTSPLLIGQLKFMFALDLGEIGPWMDTDNDGIDDRVEWRAFNGLGYGVDDILSDLDGDCYLRFLEATGGDYSSAFDESVDLDAITWRGSQGGPVILLPDRGAYEVSVDTLTLNTR